MTIDDPGTLTEEELEQLHAIRDFGRQVPNSAQLPLIPKPTPPEH